MQKIPTFSAQKTIITAPESIPKCLANLNKASLLTACIYTATSKPAGSFVEDASTRTTCRASILSMAATNAFDLSTRCRWSWHLGYRENTQGESDIGCNAKMHGQNYNKWLPAVSWVNIQPSRLHNTFDRMSLALSLSFSKVVDATLVNGTAISYIPTCEILRIYSSILKLFI